MKIFISSFTCPSSSPLGKLTLGTMDQSICLVEYNNPQRIKAYWDNVRKKHSSLTITEEKTPLLKELQKQLTAYFKKDLQNFDLPLQGVGTDFQTQVWESLCDIPYGDTWSYTKQATHMQKPKSVRAVASANAKNPISIIVPCHRVISSSGNLAGYAGGLDRKKWLLDFEKES